MFVCHLCIYYYYFFVNLLPIFKNKKSKILNIFNFVKLIWSRSQNDQFKNLIESWQLLGIDKFFHVFQKIYKPFSLPKRPLHKNTILRVVLIMNIREAYIIITWGANNFSIKKESKLPKKLILIISEIYIHYRWATRFVILCIYLFDKIYQN